MPRNILRNITDYIHEIFHENLGRNPRKKHERTTIAWVFDRLSGGIPESLNILD